VVAPKAVYIADLGYGVGHPICLCPRQKHLSTEGEERGRTPPACALPCGYSRRSNDNVFPRTNYKPCISSPPGDKLATYIGILRPSCRERKKEKGSAIMLSRPQVADSVIETDQWSTDVESGSHLALRCFHDRSYWIPGSYAPSIVREAQLLFKAIEKEGLQGGKGDNN